MLALALQQRCGGAKTSTTEAGKGDIETLMPEQLAILSPGRFGALR